MEKLTLQIESLAFGGGGVARHEGMVYFVFGALPGETVVARIDRRRSRFAQATCVEVLKPHPDRVTPGCPLFEKCGGCQYQHASYPLQLEWKQKQVAEVLRRVGGEADVVVEAVRPSPSEYGYRNRITLHWQDGRLGFFDRLTGRHILEVRNCPLAHAEVCEKIPRFARQRRESGHVTLRKDPGIRYFEQTNPGSAEILRNLVLEWIPRLPQGTLVEGYCGSGFFASALAEYYGQVIGIEQDSHAVAAAEESGISNAQFLNGDVGVLLPDVLKNLVPDQTVVLVDPPSEGLAASVLEALVEAGPLAIFYVSCDPATFARDAKLLTKRYALPKIVPVDMFPQTAQIEIAALLLRTV